MYPLEYDRFMVKHFFFLRTGNSSVDLRWVLWFRTFINIYWWLDFLSFNIYIYIYYNSVCLIFVHGERERERERTKKNKSCWSLQSSLVFHSFGGSLSFTVTVCYGSHGTSQEKFLESELKAIPGGWAGATLGGKYHESQRFFWKTYGYGSKHCYSDGTRLVIAWTHRSGDFPSMVMT